MAGFLEDKVVLVTGAANGIGRAIAEAAAESGARLVLGDIAEKALAATADELRATGAQVASQRCDICSKEDLDALVRLCTENGGHPDMVFANAGIEGPIAEPWEYDDDAFLRVVDTNIVGTWRTMKAVLPGMLQRGSGSIVAVASMAGIVGGAGVPAYVASKHGVVGLVKSVALSVAASGIRVNAICPGVVDTAMLDRMAASAPQFRDALVAMTPMGRLCTPAEVASSAICLASDRNAFVTGHALVVDGAFTVQ